MKNNIKNFKLGVFLFIVALLVLTSCSGISAPIVERDNAAKEIELAERINASEYASDDYSKAGESFGLGQGLINEKEKTEGNTKARLHYIDAYNAAKIAFDKSAGAYLASYIQETERIIKDVERRGSSDRNAISEARNKNEDAAKLLSENHFRDSLVLATEARELSGALESLGPLMKYVVKKRDTLWSIAKEKLGEAFRWIEIYRANIDQIEDFDLIYPNQIFTFNPNSSEAIEQFSFVESNDKDTHVVNYKPKGRQSLWRIAEQQLGDALLWKQIYNLNKNVIEDPSLIYPGQKLKLRN